MQTAAPFVEFARQLLYIHGLRAEQEAARHAADEARGRTEKLQALTSALSAAHTIPEIAEVAFGESPALPGLRLHEPGPAG